MHVFFDARFAGMSISTKLTWAVAMVVVLGFLGMSGALASESTEGGDKPEPAERPEVSLGTHGFSVRSADSRFSVALHAVLQVDSRTFMRDAEIKNNDGILLRRVRPILQGTVFSDFDFIFVPDFGTSSNGNTVAPTPQIFDANINYRMWPGLQLRIGKFKPPVGLEALQADVDIIFNERSLVSQLIPIRDVGLQLWGELFGGRLSYAVGLFNGVGDFRNSTNSAFQNFKEVDGRLFVQPLKGSGVFWLRGLGVGVSGTYGVTSTPNGLPNPNGGTLPGYATDGQQQLFAYSPTAVQENIPVVVADGTHARLSPQGYYYVGPVGFMGEFVLSEQRVRRTVVAPLTTARLRNTAWQVAASWLVTGEEASYSGVNPAHPFDPRAGHWGALQIAARFARLDVDEAAFPLYSNSSTSAHRATAWAAGVNWYLNGNIRVSINFSHTFFNGGGGAGTSPPAVVTRQPENVLFTRAQASF